MSLGEADGSRNLRRLDSERDVTVTAAIRVSLAEILRLQRAVAHMPTPSYALYPVFRFS